MSEFFFAFALSAVTGLSFFFVIRGGGLPEADNINGLTDDEYAIVATERVAELGYGTGGNDEAQLWHRRMHCAI